MHTTIDSIKSHIRFSVNTSNKLMNNDISDFSILNFSISMRTGKVTQPIQVVWSYPLVGWIKVNINGAFRGFLGLATCAGIFRGSLGKFV